MTTDQKTNVATGVTLACTIVGLIWKNVTIDPVVQSAVTDVVIGLLTIFGSYIGINTGKKD